MPLKLSGLYFTVSDAAIAAGLTTGRVRQMVRDGIIKTVPVDGRSYLIPEHEVRRISKPSDTGRPRSNASEKKSDN